MPPRHLAPLAACALALLGRSAAAASESRPCEGPGVEATAAFRQQYPQLVEQARAELPRTKGVDACARVRLHTAGAGIEVEVDLPDGRATARGVTRAEDVLPTLQALLLVPEPDRDDEPESAPVPVTPVRRRSLAVVSRGLVAPSATRDAAASPGKSRDSGFELSIVSGVRAGDGQYGYGGGVLSFIQLNRWLVGFHGRADGYRSLLGGDPETALALGVLLGRRLQLGDTSLDFTAGPALALRGASFKETDHVSVAVDEAMAPSSSAPPHAPPPERDVGPVPRLLLGARWGFSPRSVFRTFVGIDGEVGPRSSADAEPGFGGSGRMPAYTVGVSLGATLGTL